MDCCGDGGVGIVWIAKAVGGLDGILGIGKIETERALETILCLYGSEELICRVVHRSGKEP